MNKNEFIDHHHTSRAKDDLEEKINHLKKLEEILIKNEISLENLKSRLETFDQLYQQMIGTRYLDLDQIEAKISQYQALLNSQLNFRPSGEIKDLYRNIAKRIHPDLAGSEIDASHRHEFMARINQAYKTGNKEELINILEEWESLQKSMSKNNTHTDLLIVEQKIARIKKRLDVIRSEQIALERQDLYRLMLRSELERESGNSILQDMANVLDQKIAEAKKKLNELKERLSKQQ
jgi:hypothetical protein